MFNTGMVPGYNQRFHVRTPEHSLIVHEEVWDANRFKVGAVYVASYEDGAIDVKSFKNSNIPNFDLFHST